MTHASRCQSIWLRERRQPLQHDLKGLNDNIPVQEPRPGVIRPEADGNIITSVPRVDDVAPNGVLIVVCRTTSAPDYIKYVLGISENEFQAQSWWRDSRREDETDARIDEHGFITWLSKKEILTPPPAAPPGIEISIVAFDGREYMEPEGRRSFAFWAPLKIWRSTGVVGGVKLAPLTLYLPPEIYK